MVRGIGLAGFIFPFWLLSVIFLFVRLDLFLHVSYFGCSVFHIVSFCHIVLLYPALTGLLAVLCVWCFAVCCLVVFVSALLSLLGNESFKGSRSWVAGSLFMRGSIQGWIFHFPSYHSAGTSFLTLLLRAFWKWSPDISTSEVSLPKICIYCSLCVNHTSTWYKSSMLA